MSGRAAAAVELIYYRHADAVFSLACLICGRRAAQQLAAAVFLELLSRDGGHPMWDAEVLSRLLELTRRRALDAARTRNDPSRRDGLASVTVAQFRDRYRVSHRSSEA